MAWYREWFGEEYLDLYAHRDEEEARRHVEFFRAHAGPVEGCLLDLACGSGRHLQEFRAHGYCAIGCDLSYVMLSHGRGEYGPMPVALADMRVLPFGTASFDGLVNFFTSFGYFSREEDNLGVVAEMARVLRRGSPFLFDYLNVHREVKRLVQRETRETDSGTVEIERWFDPADRAFNKRMTIGSKRFMERVRGYDLDEISVMFASQGLAISGAFGDFDGSGYDHESPRLIVLGTRM